MRKPFVVLYRIADVTDGLTAASSAGQSGVERNVSLSFARACSRSAKLMRAWLCARCSIGCSGKWGSSGRKWQNCGMQYKLLTSFSSDATRPSPSKLGWRSLLPRLTCVLIGLSALCWTSWLNRRLVRALGIAIASVALLSLTTSCGSSRKATSSLQLTAYGLQETRDTVREQVMVAVHDTIREITTITVQTNDAGDTLKVVQITDRDRARAREAVRDKEERLVVKTDTVYIEKRDSSLRLSSLGAYGLQEDPSARSGRATVSGKLSAVSKILKWIFWIIIGLIGLIVTAKVCLRR